uniref:Uncharacterized protein n=1 Tax=Mustela putorius furo TaxID=9669 RepID=M3Y7J5_MUSPF
MAFLQMMARADTGCHTGLGAESCLPEGGAEEGAGQRRPAPSGSLPPGPGAGWGRVGWGGHDTQRAVQTFGGHSVRRHPHAAAGRRGPQTTPRLHL